eukprot:g1230.t1
MAEYTTKAKAEYLPLVQLILKKKVKKTKDIAALSMGPPLGMKPSSVAQDIAVDFVKKWIPLVWKAIKSEKKKKNMTNLRKCLKEGVENSLFGSSAAAARTPVIEAAKSQTAVPKKEMHSMRTQGLDEKSAEMWHSAFEVLDTKNKGIIDNASLRTFFNRFGEKLEDDEIEYILSKMVRKKGPEDSPTAGGATVQLTDFATFMNARMRLPPTNGRTPRFAATFNLITGGNGMMTSAQVKAAMDSIHEPITAEEASEMAAETPDKQRFMNVLNGHVLNEVEKLGFASIGGPPGAASNPELEPFAKMLKYKVPKKMVAMKMKQKGITPEAISAFLGPDF